jgi:hypothetical protein
MARSATQGTARIHAEFGGPSRNPSAGLCLARRGALATFSPGTVGFQCVAVRVGYSQAGRRDGGLTMEVLIWLWILVAPAVAFVGISYMR